jgi:hypothetical protein
MKCYLEELRLRRDKLYISFTSLKEQHKVISKKNVCEEVIFVCEYILQSLRNNNTIRVPLFI